MDGKAAVQSKTAWAMVVIVVLNGLQVVGIDTSGIVPEDVAQWITEAITIGTAAYGLYGRLVATKPITGLLRAKE